MAKDNLIIVSVALILVGTLVIFAPNILAVLFAALSGILVGIILVSTGIVYYLLRVK